MMNYENQRNNNIDEPDHFAQSVTGIKLSLRPHLVPFNGPADD